jgi:tRNA (guanine-N7-)-methyltransferase
MARKDKLKKFADVATFPNVVQNFSYKQPELKNHEGITVNLKGKWASAFFKNKNPLVLELACGKGDYTLGMARMYGKKNFLGIDIKGNRIWRGAKTALEENIHNAGFLRTRIELLDKFFAPSEVSEIWITFTDPFPKSPNRRLSSPLFLDLYRKICLPEALIHFKTDDTELFNYTVEIVQSQNLTILELSHDIDKEGKRRDELEILTFYEKQHLTKGRTIKYLKFLL